MKTIEYCPYCGNRIEDRSGDYCPYCGGPLTQEAKKKEQEKENSESFQASSEVKHPRGFYILLTVLSFLFSVSLFFPGFTLYFLLQEKKRSRFYKTCTVLTIIALCIGVTLDIVILILMLLGYGQR